MNTYLVLLRGINVGGKNKLPMAELKACLEKLGFTHVITYIASGNVILRSSKSAEEVTSQIEDALPKTFKLDSELIKALVLSHSKFQAIVDDKPEGFGDQPDKYHSDVIFLIDIEVREAMSVFNPREGVDTIFPGNGVIYSQRLSALRTKSRLSAMMVSPLYKSMTIRTWGTALKLRDLLDSAEAHTEAI